MGRKDAECRSASEKGLSLKQRPAVDSADSAGLQIVLRQPRSGSELVTPPSPAPKWRTRGKQPSVPLNAEQKKKVLASLRQFYNNEFNPKMDALQEEATAIREAQVA